VQGFELYRNEHDPCGKRAKGAVLIRETHPQKTKNHRLTEGRRRRRRGNTWRTEKCAENETGLKEAIAMASKTVALLFCRPLFPLSLSLSLSRYSPADDSEFVVAARAFRNRTWKN
jgi:hypothetical protein